MEKFVTKYDIEKTMYQKFVASVKARGNRACLHYYNNIINWNQANAIVDQIAGALAVNGVKKGDRVIVCMPNMPQTICAVYAINKIGAIASMLHPLSSADEIKYAQNILGAKLAFCFDLSEKLFSNMPEMTVIKCQTAEYFPRSVSGFVANMSYKNKISSKTEPCENVKELISFADFLKQGKAYISNNEIEIADDPMATAVTIMTSGTTGKPKAVMLSSYAINALSYEEEDVVQTVLNDAVDPDKDCMLTALPVFHGFGFAMCMHYSIISGMPQVLIPHFDVKMCSNAIEKYRISFVFGVPEFFEKVYKAGYLKCNLTQMKLMGSGGEVVPYSLAEKMDACLEEYGAKVHFVIGYGLTECVTCCTFTNPLYPARQGSIGNSCYNVQTCIVRPGTTEVVEDELGELCISAPTLMQGYFNDYEATAKALQMHDDGKLWLHTGDVCARDKKSGDIIYRQRLNRICKIEDYSVYPSYIEESYRNMDEISDCCAVGIKDEMIKLFVVKDEAHRHIDEQSLKEKIIQYGLRNLSKWSVPKQVEFIDKLPRTKSGKVDFNSLS